MPKISVKLFFYYAALPLAWLFALLWYLNNNPAPDWANLLPATETLTVWLWRLAAALTLAVIAALLPHRFYRHAADTVTNALAKFFRLSRPVQVCGAFALSLLLLEGLMLLLPVLQNHWHLDKKFWETGAFWTSAMLLVSSPVAFVVWRFRDENQSKDINLKEFQKISEWVTGAHFQDAKHGETLSGSLPENADAALHNSFSKQDGAVGLQIAAVYNLLPFYRGDYGQAFEKPSVHLLHSAWKVLQHDILQKLDKADDDKTRKDLIKQLHQRADSPLGQAITRVLLACDYNKKPLLHRHLEILPGICLSGMNFNLAGLEIEILRDTLFCGQDLTRAQWQGVRGALEWNLSQAILYGASLNSVCLYKANLDSAWLYETNLNSARLYGANFNGSRFYVANLLNAEDLSAEQLLAAAKLAGSLTNADNFFQYAQPEQQQLQEKGLIILYRGSDTVPEYLVCDHKTESWYASHAADSIPFPIDLAATQAANPDWEISIK